MEPASTFRYVDLSTHAFEPENFRAIRTRGATMMQMSDAYNELLDAAIHHLQELKAQGVRFIPVSAEGVAALNAAAQPVIRRAPAPAPTTPSALKPAEAPMPARPKPVELKPAAAADSSLNSPSEAPAVSAPPLDPAAKAAAFAELRQRAMACMKCEHLASSRKNVV